MANTRGTPLQVIASKDLNSRTNVHPKAQLEQHRIEKPKKKREKLSSLCKTPPSTIRTRGGREYNRGSCLGEGGFARCFQIKDDSGSVYAAKTIAKASIKNEKTKTKLLSEIKIHKSMSHPNIVQFIDCFEDDVNVYILLEICPNQSLMDLLKRRKLLTEPEVRFFMVQIIGAIKYMHSRRVIHRDMKLGNIFFDPEMNLKIGDFGLAAVLPPGKNRKFTICGTPNYIAPEVLTGKTTGHSFEVDTWSIGVMMYALLFGKPPFQSKDVQEIYERIKTNTYHFPIDKDVSEEAEELISSILNTNPLKRPTMDEILQHRWFRGPFPAKLPQDILVSEPEFGNLTPEESLENFYNAQKQAGLINTVSKNPVEILRSDLESEKPKKILPHSLSPGNTKNKYKEMMVTDPKMIRRISAEIKAPAPVLLRADEILAKECLETLNGINFCQKQVKLRANTESITITSKPILVSKWVDYSNKYGFSYQLSTNDIGVLFNNGNTMLKLSNERDVWYISNNPEEGWVADSYLQNNLPSNLKREGEIVNFFAKYMKTNLCKVSDEDLDYNRTEDVWLRRYARCEPYVMFELSDGSYQFNFRDHHKLCVSNKGSVITYISPDRSALSYPLVDILRYGGIPGHLDIGFEEKFNMMKDALRERAVI